MNLQNQNVVGAALQVQQLDISFGGNSVTEAVQGLDLSVAPGEFVSVLGPSGCGKSTLISAFAGLILPTRGKILVDSKVVRAPASERSVVFQHPTLFPWKDVFQNIEFGLKNQGLGRVERAREVRLILEQVGLDDFAHHYPAQLSGGMQQRVNLARALANRPRVLLMDEPFAALDAQTRFEMQELLLEIWTRQKMTVVFVTHDIDEALFLADRVIVLSRRPARVRADWTIDLRRPRTMNALTEPAFVQLKRQSLELLRSEVGRGLKRTDSASEEVPEPLAGNMREQAPVS